MKRIVTGSRFAIAGAFLIAWTGIGAQSLATSLTPPLDATARAEIVEALAQKLASSYAVAGSGREDGQCGAGQACRGRLRSDSLA